MISRTLLLESLRTDCALMMAAALSAAPALDQRVEACPEWDMAGLLGHTGAVHAFAASVVTGRTAPAERPIPPEDRSVIVDWFEAGTAAIVAALENIEDDEPCWNWAADAPQVGRFWVRRMAQETAVHRVDAELAATGTAEAIDPELAVDGIDEYLDVFLPRVHARNPVDVGDLTVHLHATDDDVDGEWFVRFGAGAPVVSREHEKGEVALQGEAATLLLALWGRVEPTEAGLALFGEPEAWARFRQATLV